MILKNKRENNDSQDKMDEEGEDLDGYMVGDDALLEYDSDVEASDTKTPKREPASVAILNDFSRPSSSTS